MFLQNRGQRNKSHACHPRALADFYAPAGDPEVYKYFVKTLNFREIDIMPDIYLDIFGADEPVEFRPLP